MNPDAEEFTPFGGSMMPPPPPPPPLPSRAGWAGSNPGGAGFSAAPPPSGGNGSGSVPPPPMMCGGPPPPPPPMRNPQSPSHHHHYNPNMGATPPYMPMHSHHHHHHGGMRMNGGGSGGYGPDNRPRYPGGGYPMSDGMPTYYPPTNPPGTSPVMGGEITPLGGEVPPMCDQLPAGPSMDMMPISHGDFHMPPPRSPPSSMLPVPMGAGSALDRMSGVETTQNPPPPPLMMPEREPAATTRNIAAEQATQSGESAELVEEDIPVAQAVDFSRSRLPSVFSCPNTKCDPPAAPIKLASPWQLFGDDHQTLLSSARSAGGGNHHHSLNSQPHFDFQITFDPVAVASVSTLEEFWRLWRYVPPPSACFSPFTYSWFRDQITPDWEHHRNRKGGTISIPIYDRDRSGLNDKQTFDDVFLTVLLGCVGESFAECANTVNGVMLKLRQSKPATLQIWTSHSDPTKLRSFAKSFRELLSPLLGEKQLQKMELFLHPRNQPPHNSLAARMTKHTGPDIIL